MATLIFKNKNLQSILRHTEEATSFRATHEEAIRAYEKDTGSKYRFDKPADLSSYDKLTKPTLWLVKDNGIYLMTSAPSHSVAALIASMKGAAHENTA